MAKIRLHGISVHPQRCKMVNHSRTASCLLWSEINRILVSFEFLSNETLWNAHMLLKLASTIWRPIYLTGHLVAIFTFMSRLSFARMKTRQHTSVWLFVYASNISRMLYSEWCFSIKLHFGMVALIVFRKITLQILNWHQNDFYTLFLPRSMRKRFVRTLCRYLCIIGTRIIC